MYVYINIYNLVIHVVRNGYSIFLGVHMYVYINIYNLVIHVVRNGYPHTHGYVYIYIHIIPITFV